jgi:2-succinyl-5-enolpyruvyl-6-hydroxy-3-cyclohexene-1-carboxylate synthase
MTEGYRTPSAPLRAMVEELVRGGVREVVVCPGSRSAPMALALRAARDVRCWVHLDERAGAFFALGAAKAARRPVAVLATSGTAVVNFAPAVTEARYGRVPLILLTADRPPELQGIGAPQTIDQVELFGRHAKWYAQLPVPDDSAEVEAEARTVVRHALEVALAAPAGPVQLDLPFREPLLPDGELTTTPLDPVDPAVGRITTAPWSASAAVNMLPSVSGEDVAWVIPAVRASARPLLVCGPLDRPGFAPAVARLAKALRAPIVADALSNLRLGSHDRSAVVVRHDVLLAQPRFRDANRPDLVVRFGATPTSKALNEMLDELAAPQWLIDDGGGWNRPTGPTITHITADPVALAEAMADLARGESSADPAWLAGWRAGDAAASDVIDTWRAGLDEPFEGGVAPALVAALSDAVVVIGNSMPVRDLEAFLPASSASVRILGNRGANGIDGLLSTAFGVAAVEDVPVVAVVGDLSLLHDVTALLAARRLDISATIVVVNNDGGGIFSFLPQATADLPGVGLPEHFEELFGTPLGIELGPLVRALGAAHQVVDHTTLVAELRVATGRPGVDVLELRTERGRNLELHRAALAAVEHAVRNLE